MPTTATKLVANRSRYGERKNVILIMLARCRARWLATKPVIQLHTRTKSATLADEASFTHRHPCLLRELHDATRG